MFERQFTETTLDRLSLEAIEKLEELIVADDPAAERAGGRDDDSASGAGDEDAMDEDEKSGTSGGGRAFLQELKQDPGWPLQLDTLLAEIVKLERVKAIGLPEGLFEGCRRRSWPGGGPRR